VKTLSKLDEQGDSAANVGDHATAIEKVRIVPRFRPQFVGWSYC
jgi:hypothetical protein